MCGRNRRRRRHSSGAPAARSTDTVLVGLNIPDMADGAFVAACHQEAQCSGVPVVVMAVTPRAAVDAIRMGARGCIRKPVDMGRRGDAAAFAAGATSP